MGTPKKKQPANAESMNQKVLQPKKFATLGIVLTPEAVKVFDEAYKRFPMFTEFGGMKIYQDKPTRSEFGRIMLVTMCQKFINDQNKMEA